MPSLEVTKILAQVNGGLYEEALNLSVDATRAEINRAHIRRLHEFSDNPTVREALNKVKGIITTEGVCDKARRLVRLDKREAALAFLIRSIDDESDAEEHHLLGYIFSRLGRNGEARTHLEKAAELRGDALDYLWLGSTYERLDMFNEAIACYESAVRQRGDAEECRQLGNILIRMERFDEALPLLNRAANLGAMDHDLEEKRRTLLHKRRVQRVKRMGKRALEQVRASSPSLVLSLAAGTVVVVGILLFLLWG